MAAYPLRFEDFPIEDLEPETPANRISFDPAESGTGGGGTSGGSESPQPEKPRRRRGCLRWLLLLVILAAVLSIAFYLRYCTPYVEEAQARGYITNVEKRGLIFKTYEGDFVSRFALEDTAAVYDRPMSFTITDDSLAKRMQRLAGTGTPVLVTYESYYGTLPWRGASKNVATSVSVEQ